MGALEEKVDYIVRGILEQGAGMAAHLDFVFQSLRNQQADLGEESSQESGDEAVADEEQA